MGFYFVSVPLTMVCVSTATKTEVDQQIFQISMVSFDFLFCLIQTYTIAFVVHLDVVKMLSLTFTK